MATITAATLDSRLHLEDAATNTDLENLIDGAIDLLNVYLLKYCLLYTSPSPRDRS